MFHVQNCTFVFEFDDTLSVAEELISPRLRDLLRIDLDFRCRQIGCGMTP